MLNLCNKKIFVYQNSFDCKRNKSNLPFIILVTTQTPSMRYPFKMDKDEANRDDYHTFLVCSMEVWDLLPRWSYCRVVLFIDVVLL